MRHKTFYCTMLVSGLLLMAAVPASASGTFAYCEGTAPSQTSCTDTLNGPVDGVLGLHIESPTAFVGHIQITLSASQLHYVYECDIAGRPINALTDCDATGSGGYYIGETITMDVYITPHSLTAGTPPTGDWVVWVA